MDKATVVGATTWGTTLAIHLCRKGVPTILLTRTSAEAQVIDDAREHSRFLPGVPLPDALKLTADAATALTDAKLVVVAVPSQRFRENVRGIRGALRSGSIVVSATKGLEMATGKTMSAVFAEEAPPGVHYCVLSGPNLAKEIINGQPASTVIAGADRQATRLAQSMLMSPTFRVYTNSDVTGVELAGALKNIIALGSGICDGMGFGDNAKAAFITRGLAEITRLGVDSGANPLTFAGLAGVGDVIATCTSALSRNRHVGYELARGRTLDEILASMPNVAEGVYTTSAALKMARKLGVEMPITQATHRVLFEGVPPAKAITELMGRPPRAE